VEVAEGELSASVVGQPPEQQLTASTVQVRRASVATLGPLRLSRPGRAVVVRLTLRLPGGGAAVADTEPFQVTPGRYHHAWCDEFPNLCPSGGPEAPTPTAPPSAAPSLPSAPASTAAPAPTAPPPLRVGEPSQLESVVSNCLPLLDDLTKVEGGRLDKPSEEHVRLCRLTLTSLPAAFEGVACSPDDTHRCAAVQQAAQALDRLAPQLTRAGRAVRDCALRSCRPDQKSSMLQAERRLGGGGSCDGGSAPLRRAAYESGFAVPAAALALSAFTVWCFSVQQRGVVPAPAGIRRPQPVQQQQAVLPPRALNARPAVM